METTQLIMLMGGGLGSLILGGLLKKWPAIPNGIIPLVNGSVFALLFATLGKLGFTYEALITGMAAAYAATAAYELKNGAQEIAEKAANKVSLFILLVAGIALLPVIAHAAENIRFRQHEPMYIATNYSDSGDWSKQDAPYLKAQASMAASILREPVHVGPLALDPELAFTWRAVNWPVGKFSSPIEESNYLPEAFLRVNEDEDGLFRGGRVGWLHNSTGTDSSSGSIDRVLGETKWAYTLSLGAARTVALTGYARGWYTLSTGAETAGIENFINFGLDALDDFGGEVMIAAETDAIRAVVILGLSYQKYEAYIPFYAAYDLSLFGQLHHGYADGIVDYGDRHTSGGVGIALLR